MGFLQAGAKKTKQKRKEGARAMTG
ncbi:hypothetical protein LB506_000744 [Fusarium annulatum]|nr:hypothetical protein LB506_000744 [Fusarium annulatum]